MTARSITSATMSTKLPNLVSWPSSSPKRSRRCSWVTGDARRQTDHNSASTRPIAELRSTSVGHRLRVTGERGRGSRRSDWGGLLDGTQGQQGGTLSSSDAGQACDVQALVAALGPQYAQTRAGAGLPQPHRPIKASAGHELTVARQRYAVGRAAVALQRCQWLPGTGLPQSYRPPATPLARSRPSADSATRRPAPV